MSRLLDLLSATPGNRAKDQGDTQKLLSPHFTGTFSAPKDQAQSLFPLSPLFPPSEQRNIHHRMDSLSQPNADSSKDPLGELPGAEKAEKAEKIRNSGLLVRKNPTVSAEKAARAELRSGSTGGIDWDTSDWLDLYEERAAIRQYDGRYTRAEAEVLAWGEIENRWHLKHGERVPRDLCAGCRRPIGSADALDLIDGTRVHIAASQDCLIRHGKRWRANATRALRALGLRPPTSACDRRGHM